MSQAADDAVAFAEAIKRAGLAGPASIALRVGGPLAWIGGQMLWVVQPLLDGLRPVSNSERKPQSQVGMAPRLARFLEGEGNVAALVAQLEEPRSCKAKTKSRRGSRPSDGEADGLL